MCGHARSLSPGLPLVRLKRRAATDRKREESLPLADFNAGTRQLLLDASALDCSRISGAIFGSVFQWGMDARARCNLGARYTSEKTSSS